MTTRTLNFLSTLRVEPLVFLNIIVLLIKELALQQLVQDKICLQIYGQSEETCKTLSQSSSQNKNQILSDVTTFLTIRQLLALLPGILTTIYIGSWCDKFLHARRIIILIGLIGSMGEVLLLLLNSLVFDMSVTFLYFASIPSFLTGVGGAMIAFLSYVTVHNKQEDRAFRFTLIEVAIYVASSVSFLIGSAVMSSKSIFFTDRMRNYEDVFILCLVLNGIMFAWAQLMMQEKDGECPTTEMSQERTLGQKVKSIFSIRHIHDSWDTLTRKREVNFHRSLWLLVLVLFLAQLSMVGIGSITYPLFQRIYNWDYLSFAQGNMIQQIFKPFATLLAIAVLLKVAKLRDLQISITGFASHVLGDIALASIISPLGFYIHLVVGSISGIGVVGIRSFLTRFIGNDEITKVYSIVSLVESVQPFFGSWLYSSIFKASIDHFPTLVFYVIASYLTICLVILCVLDARWGDFKKEDDGKK